MTCLIVGIVIILIFFLVINEAKPGDIATKISIVFFIICLVSWLSFDCGTQYRRIDEPIYQKAIKNP